MFSSLTNKTTSQWRPVYTSLVDSLNSEVCYISSQAIHKQATHTLQLHLAKRGLQSIILSSVLFQI